MIKIEQSTSAGNRKFGIFFTALAVAAAVFSGCAEAPGAGANSTTKRTDTNKSAPIAVEEPVTAQVTDTVLFNKLQLHTVHDSASARWPVKSAYPLPGAILPFNRIIAYYGNFYTANMGILGMQPVDSMLSRLQAEVALWNSADSAIPSIPAIHYIAVTAQAKPGNGGKYRLRMPFSQIEKALEYAKKINGIVFLDVQVGWSTVQEELPLLEPYLKQPQVHLGIDPEFSMKNRAVPCTKIGTMDASDVNFAAGYLADVVKKYNLPPKVLVVHRFNKGMVTNYRNIQLRPEVQIVMHMDGFGFPAKKVNSYLVAEVTEPVQFTGFKLFYKNDPANTPSKKLMTPAELVKLYPSPLYIQYQ
ncbi:MAG: hypothetical protein H7257_14630 [Taibaiella sp.]|nr:hypothetical protein [Taibaiella sp.]